MPYLYPARASRRLISNFILQLIAVTSGFSSVYPSSQAFIAPAPQQSHLHRRTPEITLQQTTAAVSRARNSRVRQEGFVSIAMGDSAIGAGERVVIVGGGIGMVSGSEILQCGTRYSLPCTSSYNSALTTLCSTVGNTPSVECKITSRSLPV